MKCPIAARRYRSFTVAAQFGIPTQGFGREVALNILPAESAAEARTVAALNHPNLFPAEGAHRIDAGRPARGQVAGHHGH
jgi:hypothetical protein